jgi:hypothetical protein
MANQANTAAYKLPDGRYAVNVDSAKTLAAADTGYVQNVIADNVVVTLPSVGPGLNFTVRNGGVKINASGPAGATASKSAKVSLDPAAADKIEGGVGGTAVANKDLINTKATSRVGDEVAVVGGATTTWQVLYRKGIWAREA